MQKPPGRLGPPRPWRIVREDEDRLIERRCWASRLRSIQESRQQSPKPLECRPHRMSAMPRPDSLSFETGAAISCGIGRGCGAGGCGAVARTWGTSCHVGERSQVTLDVSPDLLRRQITLVGSISCSASRSGNEGARSEGLRMKALPRKSALSKK